MSNASSTPISALEADIAARRARLARTVEELGARTAPEAVVAQQTEALQQRFAAATRTPDGALRVERIAVVGAAVVALIGLRIWAGRRRRARRP